MKKPVTTLAVMMLASNIAMAGVSQQSLKMSGDSINSIVTAGEVLAAGSSKFSKDGAELTAQAFMGTLAIAGQSANSTSAAVADGAEFVADKSVSAAKGVSKLTGKAVDSTSKAAQSTADATSKAAKSAADSTSEAAQSASDKAVSAASALKNAASQSANSTSQGISAAAEFTVEKVESAAKGVSHVTVVTLKSVRDNSIIVGTFSYNSASAVGKGMIEIGEGLFRVGRNVIVATSTAGVVLVTDSANGVEQVLDGRIKNGSSTIVTSMSHASKAFGSKLVK
jgi:hypothetical protein